MKKFINAGSLSKLAKRATRYFIGTEAGSHEGGHMTIKYLGPLSSSELEDIKRRMEEIASATSKFELRSEGFGSLGRYQSNVVDFIEPSDRVQKVFEKFKNRQPIPHVTFVYGNPKGKKGPFKPIEELVDQIHLFESGNWPGYKKVYTVDLQRRSPIQWIKDQFNI